MMGGVAHPWFCWQTGVMGGIACPCFFWHLLEERKTSSTAHTPGSHACFLKKHVLEKHVLSFLIDVSLRIV
jgi:hypothetical protein